MGFDDLAVSNQNVFPKSDIRIPVWIVRKATFPRDQ